jgi:hypothetical protein
MRKPATAITFSDSVFLATETLYEAADFATGFAESMLANKVPVRMGIGYGSFAALKFRVHCDAGWRRPWVAVPRDECRQGAQGRTMRNQGYANTASPIGRATPARSRAQSSIAASGEQTNSDPSVSGRRGSQPGNRARVRLELNYWEMPTTKEVVAWRGLQDMWDVAPASEHEQYQATAEAVHRMRIQLGEQPLGKLRRRTISRETSGAPGRTRTCDPRLRRPVLYPTELRAHTVGKAQCSKSLNDASTFSERIALWAGGEGK